MSLLKEYFKERKTGTASEIGEWLFIKKKNEIQNYASERFSSQFLLSPNKEVLIKRKDGYITHNFNSFISPSHITIILNGYYKKKKLDREKNRSGFCKWRYKLKIENKDKLK